MTTAGVTKERFPTLIFAAATLFALPYLMYVGRTQWFFVDDFDFFAARHISWTDLMQPHNGHWSTLPILEYRALYGLVGLRDYWPYELVAVVGHLAVAVLLYVVMRRAKVQPWIATAAGILFVFFGAGWADIVWSFQTGFTGALAFGLAAIVLLDHRTRRSDLLAFACGLAALLCSGVGLAMIVAAGFAMLLRRGWRPALAFAGPLLAIFVLWFATYGHGSSPRPSAHQFTRFAWTIVSNPFGQLSHVEWLGWLLAVVLVAGTVMAIRTTPRRDLTRYAAVLGLLVGLAVFAITTGVTRGWEGSEAAMASRYVYVGAALILPALAAAVSVLTRNRPVLVVAAFLVVLIGLPGNVGLLHPPAATTGDPGALVAASVSPRLADLPANYVVPIPASGSYVTAGWLRQARAEGKLPSRSLTATARDQATFALTFTLAGRGPIDCRSVPARSTVSVTPTQIVAVPVGATTADVVHGGEATYTAAGIFGDNDLRTVYGTVRASFDRPVRVCQ